MYMYRLQGIVGSMSRMPTFRRRFRNLVKMLYVEAIKTSVVDEHVLDSSRPGFRGRYLFGRGARKDRDATNVEHGQDDMV